MAEASTAAEVDRDAVLAEILTWRLECLLGAGCERGIANRLAAQLDVDLHQALSMLERGCPPALVLRILG